MSYFKELTCIECPNSCKLSIEMIDGKAVTVTGNKCPKGVGYGQSEAVSPVRILTSIVRTQGLPLQMLPVRTDRPIPRERVMEAMDAIKKIVVDHPVKSGDVIVEKFLGLDVNLISTRTA